MTDKGDVKMTEDPTIVDSFKFLTSLPDGAHWLCSRGDSTALKADTTYLKRKLNAVVQCLELFTDPEGNTILERFKASISRSFDCQVCIRHWHTCKKDILKKYEGDYEPDLLEHFIGNIERWDEKRLSPIIDEAARKLQDPTNAQIDPFKVLGNKALVALYDCLFIPNVLEKHYLFGDRFRVAFLGAQINNKHMRVADIVPAFTAFLFSPHEDLRKWSIKSFDKLPGDRTISDGDYELWLQQYVEQAARAAAYTADDGVMVNFWCGCNVLVNSLKKSTIVKYICGGNHDIFRMAVSHLQNNSSHLRYILRLFKMLLHKMKLDFWDAIGSIPPVALLETIFNNSSMDTLLLQVQTFDDDKVDPLLDDMTGWILPMIQSLKLATRVPSCASVLFQLLERLQDARFPVDVRTSCHSIGIRVIHMAVEDFNGNMLEGRETFNAGNRIIIRDAFQIAEDRLQAILKVCKSSDEKESAIARSIISIVLHTECYMVRNDFILLKKSDVDTAESTTFSSRFWEKVYDGFPNNDHPFAKDIVSSISGLVGLEKFIIKPETPARQAKLDFNKTLGHLKAAIANFLNRISEYDPNVLKYLVSDDKCSITLISSLFDPYQENYHSTVDILKQAFGTLGKIEALRGLLLEYFVPTMKALDLSIRNARDLETYAPMPRMFRTCDNFLDVFCSPQKGLLPLKMIHLDSTNKLLMKQFWKTQWITLGLVFDRTIRWSQIIEKEAMVEFTRDVMEYADKLFSNFTVFEQIFLDAGDNLTIDLTNDKSNKISDSGRDLLADVSGILEKIASWLRLRDEALLSMCQSLACKMLKRFHDSEIKPDASALDLCLNMAKGLKKRYITNMTVEQKAELMRAVNLHLGLPDIMPTAGTEPGQKLGEHISKKIKVESLDVSSVRPLSPVRKGTEEVKANERRIVPLVEAFSKRPPAASKPLAKKPAAPLGGSALMKDLRAGVKLDVRARNALQASVQPKATPHGLNKPAILPAAAEKATNSLLKEAETVGESSSDESSEGEDIGNAIFALTRSVKNTDKQGPRKTGFIDGPRLFGGPIAYVDTPGRKVQSVADVRARLTPDLTPLYRRIMTWNYFHDGAFPPDSQKRDYTMVAQSFTSAEQYAATFEPLLMLECWQQILTAREESQNLPFDIKVVTRLAVDNFVEIQANVMGPVMTANTFLTSDIILLSVAGNPSRDDPDTTCLAKVQSLTRKSNHVEMSFRCLPGQVFLSSVRPNATLKGLKILSLTPLEREYGALKGLPYYHLCDQIIKGRPHSLSEVPQNKVLGTMKIYKVNEPQARAIVGAVQNEGFSLIQGPPGTGKTKTVIGIVGALLSDDKGTAISVPGNKTSGSMPVGKKLLVCAPSNAAVDELVVRFKDGIVKTTGEKFVPRIVRLGKSDAINAAVRDVTLEELVDRKMNQNEKENRSDKDEVVDQDKLRAEMNDLLQQRDGKRLALDHARAEQKEPSLVLRKEVDGLSARIKVLGRQLDDARDQRTTNTRNHDIKRRQFMQEVLDDSQILCATLSGSGHEMLKNLKIEFETVIIDEAAQSIELSALIPLKYGCRKCILVGDPKQLPPTVLSREASRFAYEQSMFVRMQRNHSQSVYLLSIQYRMHPEISAFPSAMFYDSQLVDGPRMDILREQIWHNSKFFGPYRFFNVSGQEQTRGHSMRNHKEVNAALKIYQRLIEDFSEVDFAGKIGIITPYKTQLSDLRDKFKSRYGPEILKAIEFNTTDAFQGREREIIIFSCVRASPTGQVGFLSDIRRMNVGLTRAKSSLFVLGNAETLVRNEFWGQLVDDAKRRNKFTQGNLEQLLSSSTRTVTARIEKKLQDVVISRRDQTQTNVSSHINRSYGREERDSFAEEMDMKLDPSRRKSSSGSIEHAKLLLKSEANDKSVLELNAPSVLSPTDTRDPPKRPFPDLKTELHDKRSRLEANSDVSDNKTTTAFNVPSPALPPRPTPVAPGSRGPAPMKKKKRVEDVMFIKRKR